MKIAEWESKHKESKNKPLRALNLCEQCGKIRNNHHVGSFGKKLCAACFEINQMIDRLGKW